MEVDFINFIEQQFDEIGRYFIVFTPDCVDGEMDPLAYLPWDELAADSFFEKFQPCDERYF